MKLREREAEARERWYRGAAIVTCPNCGGTFRSWFVRFDGTPLQPCAECRDVEETPDVRNDA